MNNQKQIGAELISELEKERESKVIVYFTGDRQPFGSRIAEDAVRPLYEHLLRLDFNEKKKVIDLFLYSRGGDVSVPWRITSMIREFCEEFNVLVPYKAQSAATLLSLGADNIIMGKKAELGPIDPTLVKATIGEGALPQQEISVEDVNSFLSFVKERANINDQSALAEVVGMGCTPVSIQLVKKQYLKLSVFSPPSPFPSPFPSRSLWESGTLWQNAASFCCIRPL